MIQELILADTDGNRIQVVKQADGRIVIYGIAPFWGQTLTRTLSVNASDSDISAEVQRGANYLMTAASDVRTMRVLLRVAIDLMMAKGSA